MMYVFEGFEVRNLCPSYESWEETGFCFKMIDSRSCKVGLPQDWDLKKNGRGEILISDDKGRLRAQGFVAGKNFKGALFLFTRYFYECEDGGFKIYDAEKEFALCVYYCDNYERKAEEYLDEHFPNWRDPSEYWDT